MTKYLLDTNVVSELRKPKPHGGVIAWISSLRDDQLFISAVTMGELQTGIERTRTQDPAKAVEVELWVDQLEESFQVLAMDALCFREWARLMKGKPDHLLENVMIAATARVHALKVASRNERDFAQLDVDLVNPFKSRA
ncbi:MAG TPA: type II toxin-antitoxin system VapC family toxin [Terriglobia bacterium]|nr:type II toxin-antitoxin system VapC family toxin [Terriglobia bacterium]